MKLEEYLSTCQSVTLASSQATLHLDELASWCFSAHMLPPSSLLLIPTDDCANCPCERGMCSTVQRYSSLQMTALTVRASVACVAQCSLPLRHVSEDEAIVNIDLGELLP